MGVEMNLVRPPLSRIKNENGLAMLETIPLLVLFIFLISFCLGFFGMVHTAVLHSIGARAYTFETFRQRTNLYYFREDQSGIPNPLNYQEKGWRFQAVNHESDQRLRFVGTERPISLGRAVRGTASTDDTHNLNVFQIRPFLESARARNTAYLQDMDRTTQASSAPVD